MQSAFLVDTSVWQNGITFKSSSLSKPYSELTASFKEQIQTELSAYEPALNEEKELSSAPLFKEPSASALLVAQELSSQPLHSDVQELPAFLGEVQDLTKYVVSADSLAKQKTALKPGERLDTELSNAIYARPQSALVSSNGSPYNMSDKTAKAREAILNAVKRLPPKDAKVFPMDKVTRQLEALNMQAKRTPERKG